MRRYNGIINGIFVFLSCCFAPSANVSGVEQAIQLEWATNGNIVVQLEPHTDITQIVDLKGQILLEKLRFRHLLILDLASETRPSMRGEDKEHPEWYTTAGFSLMHSSFGKIDSTQGTTRHTPERALEPAPGGLAHNTVVFRCIDPELMQILQEVAATWATRPKSVSFNPRTTLDHLPSAALFRSVRSYSREQARVPLSKEQGVSCDCFVGYCLQISILHRLFPEGVPQGLLDFVKRIELAKVKMGVSKFATLPGIERDLRAMVDLFDNSFAEQNSKLHPKLIAKYKEILLYTAKSHIGNFQNMFLGSGLFECSGVAVVSPDSKLATLSGADLGRVRNHLEATVQREFVPRAKSYVIPYSAEYIQGIASFNHKLIDELQVKIARTLGEYIDVQQANYQEAEALSMRRRVLISAILALENAHPEQKDKLHQIYLNVRDEKDFKTNEFSLWQGTQAYIKTQGWEVDVLNLSVGIVVDRYQAVLDALKQMNSEFRVPEIQLPQQSLLTNDAEDFHRTMHQIANIIQIVQTIRDYQVKLKSIKRLVAILDARIGKQLQGVVPETLESLHREMHILIKQLEDPRQDLRDQSYIRVYFSADSRLEKLRKAVDIILETPAELAGAPSSTILKN